MQSRAANGAPWRPWSRVLEGDFILLWANRENPPGFLTEAVPSLYHLHLRTASRSQILEARL
jgi:hypothetical protein